MGFYLFICVYDDVWYTKSICLLAIMHPTSILLFDIARNGHINYVCFRIYLIEICTQFLICWLKRIYVCVYTTQSPLCSGYQPA